MRLTSLFKIVIFFNIQFEHVSSINNCFKPGLCLGHTIVVLNTKDEFECLKICNDNWSRSCKWASFKDSENSCVLSKSCRTISKQDLDLTSYRHASARCTGKCLKKDYLLGYPLKIKMADHLIQCNVFNLEYDGAFHFLINRKLSMNKPVKVLVKTS